MTACEACWSQAYAVAARTGESQVEVYRGLIVEDVHTCRSCDQPNDTHTLGCPMHPDFDPDRTERSIIGERNDDAASR